MKSKKGNRQARSKTTGVLLAIFFSAFTWLYTYKDDYWKFWIGVIAAFSLAITLVVPLFVWLWAVIDRSCTPKEQYESYGE